MDVTWASDFFTEEVWSLGGLVTCYVLFFIHQGTRRVSIAGCTPHPDSTWVAQQARNFCLLLDDSAEPCRYLIHDRDTCFLPLDAVLQTEDIAIVKTPYRAPKCNAFAERHVREARETLDNMILFGERHLHGVLKKIERHHNTHRPHQGIANTACPSTALLGQSGRVGDETFRSSLLETMSFRPARFQTNLKMLAIVLGWIITPYKAWTRASITWKSSDDWDSVTALQR